MRQNLKNIYINLASQFKNFSNDVHILNGHYIDKSNPNDKVFYTQLKRLSNYVEFVKIEDAVQMIVHKEKVDKPIVAFTFDDGFEECFTMIAPVLEDFKTNAAFFVNPNYVDGDEDYISNYNNNVVLTPGKKPMNWEQITDLSARGHIIGSHTMDHYRLNTDDVDVIRWQLKKSKEVIENKLEVECNYFAYPYGQYDDINEYSLLEASKSYKYIFTGCNYKNYFSHNGRTLNRRHFEGNKSLQYMKYFLSCKKVY